jgi:predicted alpha-1,6-mannanase (GH76 family)
VFWTQAPWSQDRNTVSNAPSAQLAFRLHQVTSEQSYLDWGMEMYNWVDSYLRDPVDMLYWDHVDVAGHIEKTKWSYNQGTMLGASLLLYQIQKKSGSSTADSYLQRSEQIARKSVDYYSQVGYFTQDPPFNAIYFRNLLALYAVTADQTLKTKVLSAVQGYADKAWLKNRDSSNRFYFPAGMRPAKLLDQAAMVEILSCLSWSPANYDLLV